MNRSYRFETIKLRSLQITTNVEHLEVKHSILKTLLVLGHTVLVTFCSSSKNYFKIINHVFNKEKDSGIKEKIINCLY